VDVTGSGLCPVTGFGRPINGVEPSGSTAILLGPLSCQKNLSYGIGIFACSNSELFLKL
jgi:hypothetical protein